VRFRITGRNEVRPAAGFHELLTLVLGTPDAQGARELQPVEEGRNLRI
jgi:hypothetical protein